MKKWRWLTLAVVVVTLLWGASAMIARRQGEARLRDAIPGDLRSALASSQKFVLLALYPYPNGMETVEVKGKKIFHDHRVLGETVIDDSSQKHRILDEFYRSIKGGNPDEVAACFLPRHAIQATHNGTQFDFVICFGCGYYVVYRNGVSSDNGGAPISDAARSEFDRVLGSAGIKNPY